MAALPTGASASVWEVTRNWDAQAEKDYREWVATHWDQDIFARPGNPYSGLLVDCADAVYSMRVIFAATHGLPFSMRDPTSRRGVISQAMSRWDRQAKPEDRLRSFLRYIYALAGTSTLPADTYPIAITRDAVTSGTLILTDKASHHSWPIRRVNEYGLPALVYSSRPARTVLLTRESWPTPGFVFPGGMDPSKTQAGLRAFRLPEEILEPVWKAKGYSLEQYDLPKNGFFDFVQQRVKTFQEGDRQILTRLFNDACKGAQERVEAVREGVAFLNTLPANGCMNAQSFDDYSTPNRDRRTEDALEAAQVQAMRQGLAGIQDIPRHLGVSECDIEWSPDQVLSLAELRDRFRSRLISWNPNDPIEVRWGELPGPSSRAARCPVY